MKHHELAKQARYHCAIRPTVIIDKVKNMYRRFMVRQFICYTSESSCYLPQKSNQETLGGN